MPARSSARAAPYDVVIEGGKVVDGSGAPWFYGDVAVRGAWIARVAPAGMLKDAPARTRIDAEGKVVAPGFIDIMGHSKGALLRGDSRLVSKVTQGITTEILGESTTLAPVSEKMLSGEEGEGKERLRRFGGPRGFGRWLEAMQAHGMSVNAGSFVGATTVRAYAMGAEEGAPSSSALDTMRAVARRAMQDGAFGLASALIYPPGSFASTEELAAVAAATAPYGGLYITHLRSEGDQLLEAADEAITIGKKAGVPVEIYHLKAAGRRNWHKADAMIRKIDSARATGLDVQANMYPYAAASTGLTACLPPWASAGGHLAEKLQDPTQRAEIRAAMQARQPGWENFCQLAGPEGVLILGLETPRLRRWNGKTLAEIAAAQDQPWTDAVMDLVAAEGAWITTVYALMDEGDVRRNLRQPWMKFGTDAGGRDPETAEGLAHPRAYGTYPRILGRYVREEGVLPLEEAVRKMTSAVAVRLSLEERGLLRPGMYADLAVFDAGAVEDRATYEVPHQLSRGIEHVFVNGTAVVRRGVPTGATPGRIVRGPGFVPDSPPSDSVLSGRGGSAPAARFSP